MSVFLQSIPLTQSLRQIFRQMTGCVLSVNSISEPLSKSLPHVNANKFIERFSQDPNGELAKEISNE